MKEQFRKACFVDILFLAIGVANEVAKDNFVIGLFGKSFYFFIENWTILPCEAVLEVFLNSFEGESAEFFGKVEHFCVDQAKVGEEDAKGPFIIDMDKAYLDDKILVEARSSNKSCAARKLRQSLYSFLEVRGELPAFFKKEGFKKEVVIFIDFGIEPFLFSVEAVGFGCGNPPPPTCGAALSNHLLQGERNSFGL